MMSGCKDADAGCIHEEGAQAGACVSFSVPKRVTYGDRFLVFAGGV